MSDFPKAQAGILKIDNYVPGRTKAPSGQKTIKLSSNESPLGASPMAIEAYKNASENLSLYPDPACTELREALAEKHNLDADNIVIGSGSDELLHLLAQIYLGEGDEAIINQFGFLVYPIITKGAGATPVFAKADDYKASVDAILAMVSEKTKVIFLDNPNNPCGTYLNVSELQRLHAGIRPDILLVIDSAYAEYADTDDYDAGVQLVAENNNVVMVRTFSKIGLAALRLGWLYAPNNVVDTLNRLRGPFNVNMAAQTAGIAALADDKFTSHLVSENKKWRDWLSNELTSNILRVLPSQANFITIIFPNEENLSAKKADQVLLENGLVTRQLDSYGLPNALRISIGNQEAMGKLAQVLQDFIKGNKNV